MSPSDAAKSPRTPLTPERILDAAMALADDVGIQNMTIRRLAASLDVKPMTIYHHIPNKAAILDGMVDRVFAEISLPPTDTDWKTAIRVRSESARTVIARHPWAVSVLESRSNPGPATLAHHDAVLGCLRRALSVEMAAHAYAVLDAFIYGFTIQEAALPATDGEGLADLAETIIAPTAESSYPYLTELTAEHVSQPGYDFAAEFDFGLDLILDGLEAASEPQN